MVLVKSDTPDGLRACHHLRGSTTNRVLMKSGTPDGLSERERDRESGLSTNEVLVGSGIDFYSRNARKFYTQCVLSLIVFRAVT